MGRRTCLVEPCYGCPKIGEAGSGTAMEHLAYGQLAVEDVATDKAIFVFDGVWSDDLAVQD